MRKSWLVFLRKKHESFFSNNFTMSFNKRLYLLAFLHIAVIYSKYLSIVTKHKNLHRDTNNNVNYWFNNNYLFFA